MDLDVNLGVKDDKEEGIIHLTKEDKRRLYLPWSASLVVKFFGKRLLYAYLRNKLQDLWNPSEPLTLIDLGNDYHIVKFRAEENKNKILHEGPWFVAGNFVLVRHARICVQVPVHFPLRSEVRIGSHRQKIVYEGDGILCTRCGKIGLCKSEHWERQATKDDTKSPEQKPEKPTDPNDGWEVVKFPKRNRVGKGLAQQAGPIFGGRDIGPTDQEGPKANGQRLPKRNADKPNISGPFQERRMKGKADFLNPATGIF